MSTIIDSIEKEQLRRVPRFQAGDRVRVHFRVIEGSRTRTQVFEGVVIKRQGSGVRETFTVRKQSFGVGVERTFPIHSPKIEQLEVAARGDVRRAKLYYLRDRVGKAARVAERRWGITDDVLDAEEAGAVDAEGAAQEEAEVEVDSGGGRGSSRRGGSRRGQRPRPKRPRGRGCRRRGRRSGRGRGRRSGHRQGGRRRRDGSEGDSTEDEASEQDG